MSKYASLEAAFAVQLGVLVGQAAALGVPQQRLLQGVEKFGAINFAKNLLSKGKQSEGFSALAGEGHLHLSLEALITAEKFAALFTDEEVNACFEALCEGGYYTH